MVSTLEAYNVISWFQIFLSQMRVNVRRYARDFPKPLDSAIYKKIQQRVRDEIMAPLEKTHGRVPSGRGGCQLDAAVVGLGWTPPLFTALLLCGKTRFS
jgi:hypothetical protein